MCRFMVYLGSPALLADLVTRPSHSLTRQSYNAKERLTAQGYLNGDGFGIGWYSSEALNQEQLSGQYDTTPCVFSSTQPAWNNRNLERLANKIVSPLIFAHVRAAYPGIPVSDSNCQPFVCGRYMFMHNGGVGGFHEVRRKLLNKLSDPVYKNCPSFESDSAICFSLFLNLIEDTMAELKPEELVLRMQATISTISEVCAEAGMQNEQSLLNFVVSDGKTVVCTRYTNEIAEDGASLYYASGTKFECVDRESNRYMVRHADKRGLLGMVASEPLTEDKSDWIKVPRNTMVVMSRYKGEVVDLHLVPIHPSAKVASDISRSFRSLSNCPPKSFSLLSHSKAGEQPRITTSPQHSLSVSGTTAENGFHGGNGLQQQPVLALAVSGSRIFAGMQSGCISVFDLRSFKCEHTFKAHNQTIFALTVQENSNTLYSSSTRSVNQWDITTWQRTAALRYSDGDVFALALAQGRPIAGPAGTSIVRCVKPQTREEPPPPPSPGVPPVVPPQPLFREPDCSETPASLHLTDTLNNGHCSRVYALAVCPPRVCSGAGDGFVKVWALESGKCVSTLHGHKGAVLALMAVQMDKEGKTQDSWRLYSGSRDNTIRVWDLKTLVCMTTLMGHDDDILALAHGHRGEFYSASSDCTVRMWSLESHSCLQIFEHRESTFLSIACTEDGFVTGSSDGVVRYWVPEEFSAAPSPLSGQPETNVMEQALRQFVRIRTVSRWPVPSSQSSRALFSGAKFLLDFLESFGAEGKLATGPETSSPVVLGRYIQDPSQLTITVCGHYDVSDADEAEWRTDPFDLVAENGQLFGRGVSDNKGPIIATLFAIKELIASGGMKVNLNFVFDGMYENGGQGFREVVKSNLDWFQNTGLILSTSGAWISDKRPCLIYGMRGLICLSVSVSGPKKDLHSGTDGGAFKQPMMDLIAVLSSLTDSSNRILIPSLYDDVQREDEEEAALYEGLDFDLEEYKLSSGIQELTGGTPGEVLRNRWRNPSLSVVKIDSHTDSWSTVPRKCTAKVVIRHVPNQNPHRLVEAVKSHVQAKFAELSSHGNTVSVDLVHVGDWWLADPSSSFYKRAEKAIFRQWGVYPMFVREGQTIPVVPFLERVLGAPALVVPICQATDYMAQQNERLSWKNFVQGKEVMKDLIQSFGV